MTTKFTPGPWYVGTGTYEGRNIYSAVSVTDDEGFTYQPVVATAEDDGINCWDANARLIAAAPDLLEALQNIAEYWNQDQNEAAMADACWHAIHTARAAIARATGESK